MKRAVILCPGRGSYTERSLGSLDPEDPWVVEADRLRAHYGLDSLLDLDGAQRFSAARHLRPANVAALIYVISMVHGRKALLEHEVVAIGGNSMGWYTALAMSGALPFESGFRLVQEMALLQESGVQGGQIIYPIVDAEWQPASEQAASVSAVLRSGAGKCYPSIHLGGYAILAGNQEGMAHMLAELPKVVLGKVSYPFRLAQHGPYHTPLAAGVSQEARKSLRGLSFAAPTHALIDGKGRRYTPWSCNLLAMREYTLGAQVTEPYDFGASVRVALREYAPDRIVLPGPGNTLGGICGQILIREGWRGIRSRADFDAVQKSDDPILVSMDR